MLLQVRSNEPPRLQKLLHEIIIIQAFLGVCSAADQGLARAFTGNDVYFKHHF